MLVSLIPAVAGVISIGIVLFYPLNESKMEQIGAELKARRARETADAEPAAAG